MSWLFSYGTLRQPAVQMATFRRILDTQQDVLLGYVVGRLRIADPDVIALSGSTDHPILRPSDNLQDEVAGAALAVTEADLAKADAYEDPAYVRTLVTLRSGRQAFAYVARDR